MLKKEQLVNYEDVLRAVMRDKVCEDSFRVVKQVLTRLWQGPTQTHMPPPSCTPSLVFNLEEFYTKYMLKRLVKHTTHKSVGVSLVSGAADLGSNKEIMPI